VEIISHIFRYFTVIGSKLFKQREKYHVSITSQGYDDPQSLEVAIKPYYKKDAKRFGVSQNITLINEKSQQIEFDVIVLTFYLFHNITCLL
jgi:hypothetical protein